MTFRIDPRIFETFPGVTIGAVVARGLNNTTPSPDITALLREQEERIRSQFTRETLSQHPPIGIWRKIYKQFGVKGNDYRSSVESLYRVVLRGQEIRTINPLVDIYNLISLKYCMPVGGENSDRIQGDLVLTFAGENETPVQVLGENEVKPPEQGEVIYRDDISTVCRRWNWREVDRTKLTEATTNAILVIEAMPPVGREDLQKATEELKALVGRFCGGTVRPALLDATYRDFPV